MGLFSTNTPRFDRISGKIKSFCRGCVGSKYDGYTVATMVGDTITSGAESDSVELLLDFASAGGGLDLESGKFALMEVRIVATAYYYTDGVLPYEKSGIWKGTFYKKLNHAEALAGSFTDVYVTSYDVAFSTPVLSISDGKLVITCEHTGTTGEDTTVSHQATVHMYSLKGMAVAQC